MEQVSYENFYEKGTYSYYEIAGIETTQTVNGHTEISVPKQGVAVQVQTEERCSEKQDREYEQLDHSVGKNGESVDDGLYETPTRCAPPMPNVTSHQTVFAVAYTKSYTTQPEMNQQIGLTMQQQTPLPTRNDTVKRMRTKLLVVGVIVGIVLALVIVIAAVVVSMNKDTSNQGDACNPNPCNNGGVCTGTGGSDSTCACATGWTGNTCQNSICDTIPCMYSGTCTPTGTATYTCDCMAGFSGLQCQVTPCDVVTHCLHSGTCVISGYTHSCNCPSGFSGNNCEVTPCTPTRCSYGGTCNIVGSNYTCSCQSGYSGSTCQNTPCTGPPCIMGTCTITGNSYNCTCTSSVYSGTNCQYNYLGSITSLNYPFRYPNSHSESHTLYSGSSVWKLRIQFDAFDTEAGYDYFKAYDGSSSNNTLLATWSGTSIPSEVTSSGAFMLITFTTDETLTYTGWRAYFYAVLV